MTLTVSFPTSGESIGPGRFVGVNFSPDIASGQFLRVELISDASGNPTMMNHLWTCTGALSFSSVPVIGWQGNLNSATYFGPVPFQTESAIHEGAGCHLDVSVLDASFSPIDTGGVLGLVYAGQLFAHDDMGALARYLRGSIAGTHSVDDIWNAVNRQFP